MPFKSHNYEKVSLGKVPHRKRVLLLERRKSVFKVRVRVKVRVR